MGTLGRLKKLLTEGERPPGEQYECLSCHETFQSQRQVCPDCGGYDIRSTEWLDDQRETRPPDGSV